MKAAGETPRCLAIEHRRVQTKLSDVPAHRPDCDTAQQCSTTALHWHTDISVAGTPDLADRYRCETQTNACIANNGTCAGNLSVTFTTVGDMPDLLMLTCPDPATRPDIDFERHLPLSDTCVYIARARMWRTGETAYSAFL